MLMFISGLKEARAPTNGRVKVNGKSAGTAERESGE
jgi:hypothetical protein